MSLTEQKLTELKHHANEVRKGIIRGVHAAKSGHPGGSLSATELFTYLYMEEMNVDPKNPHDPDRDRFVLSKGHTAPGYYATLAERGFFPMEDMETLRHTGSYLQGHPDRKHIPGVDMSSGSLGQGGSAAVGMALSAKLRGKSYRTYCLFGAGEIIEIKLPHRKETEMLPFTKQYVPTINLEEGYIIVSSATMIFADDDSEEENGAEC